MSVAPILVVGAGVGGLAAALRLARGGQRVRVLEARSGPGGLASGFEVDGFAFDAGPYVLLDRPGLEWAFGALGLDLSGQLALSRIEDVYEVMAPGQPPVAVRASLDETADGLERTWPGTGARYIRWVRGLARTYQRLAPLLRVSDPRTALLRNPRAWPALPFLLRSLASALDSSGLPAPARQALGIWTHVAGQRLAEAPSLLALVPVLVHTVGAWYPREGIAAVPRALARAAESAGVEFEYGVEARMIRCRDGRAVAVETRDGRSLPAAAVVSNAGGLGTYLDLLGLPQAQSLRELPLQSPGVCAYLAARGRLDGPYLRFLIPGDGSPCRLWIRPAVPDPSAVRDGWWPARLLAPMAHARAESLSEDGQAEVLEGILAEDWWRQGVAEHRVLRRRLPRDWGREYHLHRDAMNPVMTARLTRRGRLPHRSPWVRGLYLAGSSTHPGQWVSFCAMSGVLAADRLLDDLG